jgi:hypothetical protein
MGFITKAHIDFFPPGEPVDQEFVGGDPAVGGKDQLQQAGGLGEAGLQEILEVPGEASELAGEITNPGDTRNLGGQATTGLVQKTHGLFLS